jgi:serine phosphatase RsbU (regulator of sigma subunit)
VLIGSSAQVGIAFFYAFPTGLAAWWFGTRIGLGFALCCISLYLVGAAIHPVDNFVAATIVRTAVLLTVAIAAGTARNRISGLEHSAEELEAIRMALTPPSVPVHAGIDAAAAFIPSEHGVSGDFYLLTNSPDGSTVAVVGDVVGHGPEAARLATFTRARLASFAANSSDPAEILRMANDALLERGRRDELVSAVCLRFHASSRTLSWASAGHPAPLELPNLDSLKAPEATLPLGSEPGLAPVTAEARLEPESGVLVYTDGATDLRLAEGTMLGLEGLQSLLAPVSQLPAEALVGEIEETLLDYAHGEIRDDICVLVLRPSGP